MEGEGQDSEIENEPMIEEATGGTVGEHGNVRGERERERTRAQGGECHVSLRVTWQESAT